MASSIARIKTLRAAIGDKMCFDAMFLLPFRQDDISGFLLTMRTEHPHKPLSHHYPQ